MRLSDIVVNGEWYEWRRYCENFASWASNVERVKARSKAQTPLNSPLQEEKVRKSNDLVEKEGAEVWMRRRKRMAYLLELLDGTLVDTTALVDQVTGGGRLTGVDVADNDDVNVSLFLTAGDG
jgi:hypothetical protein